MQLVQTITSDELVLNALLSEGDKSKSAIIYIHGFMGNFYTNPFLIELRKIVEKTGFAFLAIETRGSGIVSELNLKGFQDTKIIGSYNEILSEAHLDISAWIKYLQNLGYEKFILAGHSLGTMKTVRYLFEGEYKNLIEKIVLLAPFDKNGYIERKTKGEYKKFVEIAKQKVLDGKGMEIIPDTFDDYQTSYQTYISWYEDTELGNMFDFYRKNYSFPVLNSIEIPTLIIVGDKDKFFNIPEFNSFEQAQKILEENIKNVDFKRINNADHCYVGYDREVAEKFSEFILK